MALPRAGWGWAFLHGQHKVIVTWAGKLWSLPHAMSEMKDPDHLAFGLATFPRTNMRTWAHFVQLPGRTWTLPAAASMALLCKQRPDLFNPSQGLGKSLTHADMKLWPNWILITQKRTVYLNFQ